MHEIEPQPIRGHERAGLLDVRAEHLPQRRMKQVGRRMIAAGRVANLIHDFGGHDLPAAEASRIDAREVKPRPRLTGSHNPLDHGE